MRYLILLAALLLGPASVTAAVSLPAPNAASPAPRAGDDVQEAGRGVVRVVVALEYPDGRNFDSVGSGFAVSPRHIVTNYHVVELFDLYAQYAARSVFAVVPSHGSRTFQARLVYSNPQKDLALLEISEGTLPVLQVLSDVPQPGERVTALGYPMNVDLVTARTARDLFRPTPPRRFGGELSSNVVTRGGADAYLHDVQIAGGNSGGPLVDRCGRVLGVNTLVTARQEYGGMSAFAVSNRELLTFLGSTDVQPRTASGECVTSAERAQRRAQQVNATIAQARSSCEADNQRSREDHARISAAALERAEDREQTFLFIAIGLLVLGGVAGAGALVMHGQGNKRGMAIAGAAGGLLLVAAAVIFIMRDQGLDMDSQAPALQNCEAAATEAASRLEGLPGSENMVDALPQADIDVMETDNSFTSGM